MITKKDYVEYLISTPFNYTCTNMADHKDPISHDTGFSIRNIFIQAIYGP